MYLTDQVKQEMVQDGQDERRKYMFRKLRESVPRVSFTEFLTMMESLQEMFPESPRRPMVVYQTVKI